mmetsp:Transcript_37791/g.119216  ORF Transcript_37791/g.119216 Transcript_37791/m.119216 type:complete len:325 (-) Transcript_37791:142-1116(-)
MRYPFISVFTGSVYLGSSWSVSDVNSTHASRISTPLGTPTLRKRRLTWLSSPPSFAISRSLLKALRGPVPSNSASSSPLEIFVVKVWFPPPVAQHASGSSRACIPQAQVVKVTMSLGAISEFLLWEIAVRTPSDPPASTITNPMSLPSSHPGRSMISWMMASIPVVLLFSPIASHPRREGDHWTTVEVRGIWLMKGTSSSSNLSIESMANPWMLRFTMPRFPVDLADSSDVKRIHASLITAPLGMWSSRKRRPTCCWAPESLGNSRSELWNPASSSAISNSASSSPLLMATSRVWHWTHEASQVPNSKGRRLRHASLGGAAASH